MKRLPIMLIAASSWCATAPRQPCSFSATFTLREDADEVCRPLVGKRRDDGSFIEDTDDLRGCAAAEARDIQSNGTKDNLSNELEHLVKKWCPGWR